MHATCVIHQHFYSSHQQLWINSCLAPSHLWWYGAPGDRLGDLSPEPSSIAAGRWKVTWAVRWYGARAVMQRLSRFLSWFETQDIKTHSYFNRYLYLAGHMHAMHGPCRSLPLLLTFSPITLGDRSGDHRSPGPSCSYAAGPRWEARWLQSPRLRSSGAHGDTVRTVRRSGILDIDALRIEFHIQLRNELTGNLHRNLGLRYEISKQ